MSESMSWGGEGGSGRRSKKYIEKSVIKRMHEALVWGSTFFQFQQILIYSSILLLFSHKQAAPPPFLRSNNGTLQLVIAANTSVEVVYVADDGNSVVGTEAMVTRSVLDAQIAALNASFAVQLASAISQLSHWTASQIQAVDANNAAASHALNVSLQSAVQELNNEINARFAATNTSLAIIDSHMPFLVDSRHLSSIDGEITNVVNAMTEASPAANSLANVLSTKLTASASCQCIDPLTIQSMSSTINKSLSCQAQGKLYTENLDSCKYAQPYPMCSSTITTLPAFASVTSCSSAPNANGDYLFDTTCTAACDQGYRPSSATFTCTISGSWTSAASGSFTCRRKCAFGFLRRWNKRKLGG